MNKNEYANLVKNLTPKENKAKDYKNAFLMGGFIGLFSEILKLILINVFHLTMSDTISWILLILIFLASLFTALGFFDKLVCKYKCGLIIPITGFAHAIMSASLDYKKDGLITGLGANFFKLAGSVLLYGIVSGFIMGLLKVILYA